jgi:hypothetical protein
MATPTESSQGGNGIGISRWGRVLDDADWREVLGELASSYHYCV